MANALLGVSHTKRDTDILGIEVSRLVVIRWLAKGNASAKLSEYFFESGLIDDNLIKFARDGPYLFFRTSRISSRSTRDISDCLPISTAMSLRASF